jgi:hypothetical protein
MRAEKNWERKKWELGRNQGSWAALKRKEEKREMGCAESSRARKGRGCMGFSPIKLSFENSVSYYQI